MSIQYIYFMYDDVDGDDDDENNNDNNNRQITQWQCFGCRLVVNSETIAIYTTAYKIILTLRRRRNTKSLWWRKKNIQELNGVFSIRLSCIYRFSIHVRQTFNINFLNLKLCIASPFVYVGWYTYNKQFSEHSSIQRFNSIFAVLSHNIQSRNWNIHPCNCATYTKIGMAQK